MRRLIRRKGPKVSDKPIRAPKPIQLQTEIPQVHRWGLYKAQTLAGLSFLQHVTIHSNIKYSQKLIFLNL